MTDQVSGLGEGAKRLAPAFPQSPAARKIRIIPLGMSLGFFLSLTFVLCVLFDLWFPPLAMNSAWSVLLPGFVWISWTSLLLGLVETFAYGWYVALLFGGLYNFWAARGGIFGSF